MPQAAPDPKANFSANNSNPGVRPPSLRATARLPQRGCPGDGQEAARPADKVQMLQAMVHGVTTEECQAALQSHSWSVQRAAQYLKVPSLPACPGIQGPCELVLLYLTLPSGSMSCALCYSGTRGSSVSNATSPSALR
ncbi:activated CDC42 kinase 1-like [Grammomys surdaster]|uniref:activated CDC42 kinase 1-like n=1 Tax=Grammomys surdaster TaxID=491861 RepID=UPI00109FEC7C|nr:activated CDC42 kinase 1-like [Grammomys surdaster]